MSVIKQGTVSVTNGSATVTGTGTSWLGQVAPGQVFALVGEVSYTIASVASDTSLKLTAPYGGTTKSGQTYSVTRDFTTGGLPLLAPGTVSASGVLNPVVQALEDANNARLIAQNPGDVAGTAATADKQTSPTDTTADALMAVGAGGWLGNGEVVDESFVSPKTRMVSVIPGDFSGVINYINIGNSSNLRASQIGVQDAGVSKENPRAFFRHARDGVFGPRRELYHTGNILGTVSQSGGEPTGALFEKGGSDSDGYYEKSANGTLIQRIPVTFDTAQKGGQLFSIPLSLVRADYSITISAASTEGSFSTTSRVISGIATFASGVDSFTIRNPDVVDQGVVQLIATIVGEWY